MSSEANGQVRRFCSRGLFALTVLGLVAPACLDRPISPPQPVTKGTSTRLYQNQQVDKIDLLFMIDNSPSMADKQMILAEAVPDLVERFTNPVCVDRETREYKGKAPPGAFCNDLFPGTQREFDPIGDIHIGVITSSLGGVGADTCSPSDSSYNPTQEDMSHLITRGMDSVGNDTGTVSTYQGKGFLNWDPTGKKSNPPGENDVDELKKNFTLMVRGANQMGCRYEMSLEAWRRFLVDPAPYEKIVPVRCRETDEDMKCRRPEGIDHAVLQQRKDFLRNDSLLLIVMLSDENDCSAMAGAQGYLPLQNTGMKKGGTKACLTDPWSPDCMSCLVADPAIYPECNEDLKDDPRNLRCFEQKRRFGVDFLYPIRRYIDALQEPRFEDGTFNPVFCNDFVDDKREECKVVQRDPSYIFLAGIIGLPWQDVAIDPTDLKKGYRPAEQLNWQASTFKANGIAPPANLPDGKTLWNVILGEVDEVRATAEGQKNDNYGAIKPTVEPLDPLMRESVAPRTGTHPITGQALVQPEERSVAHAVNASEREIPDKDDLQYACVFDLPDPIDCSLAANQSGCDCSQGQENPLCYNQSTEQYGTQQFRAKAYPGRRQLAVLKGMGDQAIVASICPANTDEPDAADFGYRPAIGAIVDRLKPALQGACWNQELEINDRGQVSCVVLEVFKEDLDKDGNCPPCVDGRSEASAEQKQSLEGHLIYNDNQLYCVCIIKQTEDDDLEACVSQEVVNHVQGWCYVDPAKDDTHNEDIVATCPPANKRLIRFVGDDIPRVGSLTFLQCQQ